MATYLIGDVHGCAIVNYANFSIKLISTPNQDTLLVNGGIWLLEDLIHLKFCVFVKSLGSALKLVLGNHDLHLLGVFAKISRNKPKDKLNELLNAPDADELINWLRRQPLLQVDEERKSLWHTQVLPSVGFSNS